MGRQPILPTLLAALIFGGISTGALAGPPADNPGQPFAKIIERLEAIQTKLDEASAEILSAIGEIGTELDGIGGQIAAVQADINGIKTDLDTLKGDTAEIKGSLQTLQGAVEDAQPLTQFRNLVRSVSEFGNDTKKLTQDITSTGPMLAEICKRSGIGSGTFQENLSGEGVVLVRTLPADTEFGMEEEGVPECRTVGINPGETLRIVLIADAGVIDIARVTADIAIRTTPFATITIFDSVIEVID